MQPRRIAIACQGGGAQTAFTAGVLTAILEEYDRQGTHTPDQEKFEIVALSGTSGGAVCAALAWDELLTGARDRLERFWLQGYPDGNAAEPLPVAMVHDLLEVGQGRLPWVRTADSLRMELGLWLLEHEFPGESFPFSLPIELKPYSLPNAFAQLDAWKPPLMDAALDALKRLPDALLPMAAFVPQALWLRNLMMDALRLNPLDRESLLRRECDVQEAFRALLRKTFTDVEIDRLRGRVCRAPSPNGARPPELLIGAVDVQRTHTYKAKGLVEDQTQRIGEEFVEETDHHKANQTNFTVFRGSANLHRLVDCIIASAAIPTVMRAVEMDGTSYWDGLYSSNPPITDLPDLHGRGHPEANPEEIWVIRINPLERTSEPERIADIFDRRNELAGNLALLQEVRTIVKINEVTQDNDAYRKVAFGFIDMTEERARGLDYPSKLSRRRGYLRELFEDGQEQGRAFLERWRHCPLRQQTRQQASIDVRAEGEVGRLPAPSASPHAAETHQGIPSGG